MLKMITICLAVLFAQAILNTPAHAEDNALVAANCNMCHSVSALGIEKKNQKMQTPDLSTVGKDHDQEYFKKYLQKEVASATGKMHPTKVTDPQKLEAVSAQLAGLGK